MPKQVEGATWTIRELELKRQVEAGRTVVANMHTARDNPGDPRLIAWAKERGLFVPVERTTRSKWRNRLKMKNENDEERDRVCDAYEEWLREQSDLLACIPDLKGKVLGCWCGPLRCHGDIVARLANGEEG
jgi:hypothetical protein